MRRPNPGLSIQPSLPEARRCPVECFWMPSTVWPPRRVTGAGEGPAGREWHMSTSSPADGHVSLGTCSSHVHISAPPFGRPPPLARPLGVQLTSHQARAEPQGQALQACGAAVCGAAARVRGRAAGRRRRRSGGGRAPCGCWRSVAALAAQRIAAAPQRIAAAPRWARVQGGRRAAGDTVLRPVVRRDSCGRLAQFGWPFRVLLDAIDCLAAAEGRHGCGCGPCRA